jgi:hypothetical protein
LIQPELRIEQHALFLSIGLIDTAGVAFNGPKIAVLQYFFVDTMSDFAQILAPCRAINSTNPTIRRPVLECKEGLCMVGSVDLGARHSANIRAKRGYFTS